MLDRTGQAYCDDCLPERQAEQAAGWAEGGKSALARLRAEGADPARGREAGRKRTERNAAHMGAVAYWEQEQGDGGPADPGASARAILPRLRRFRFAR